MAKAIVLSYHDVDQGAGANDLILKCSVAYVGAGVPNAPLISRGADEGGVSITIAINALAQYANNVEDALLVDAIRLGIVGLTRSDCLFPDYLRGA